MSDRVATQGASWRQREIIEHLKGGFTIDFDGSKSIEDARVVAGLIHRRWPEVSHHLIELENTARWLARLSAELDKCESAAQVDALHARDTVQEMFSSRPDVAHDMEELFERARARVGYVAAVQEKKKKTIRIIFPRDPPTFVSALAAWDAETRDAIGDSDECKEWLKTLSDEDYKYIQQAVADHVAFHKARLKEPVGK